MEKRWSLNTVLIFAASIYIKDIFNGWIKINLQVDKYSGQRSHEELKAYVSRMLEKSNDQVNSQTDNSDKTHIQTVLSLTDESFKHGIETGISFVMFFAPWCGHCKRLAPVWEHLGKKFFGNENVNIAKVDCTLYANKNLCNEQEVDGFPSLYLYRDGQKVSEYNGSRGLDILHEFVSNHLQRSKHNELWLYIYLLLNLIPRRER